MVMLVSMYKLKSRVLDCICICQFRELIAFDSNLLGQHMSSSCISTRPVSKTTSNAVI